MSAGWTPGPWRAEHSLTSEGRHFWTVYAADGDAVHYMTLRDREDLRANASLTAAAPELYDLLFEIEDTHGSWLNGDLGKRTRALLAKVRGETL